MRTAANMAWNMMESGELPVILPPRLPQPLQPLQTPQTPQRARRKTRTRPADAAAAVMARAALAVTPLLHAAEMAHVRTVTRVVMMAHANDALSAILARLR